MATTQVLSVDLISLTAPVMFDDLKNGQGTILYNHNSREILVVVNEDGSIVETTDKEKATGKGYKYDSCRVEYPKTGDNIFRTLLNAKYDSNHQEKLINEFQSAQMGLMDESKVEAYKAFLEDRIAIREMVDSDCKAHNVPIN